MSYKTLLTFVVNGEMLKPTLDFAITMARQEDAHLEVCCLGVDHTQVGYFYAGAPAMVYQETLDRARDEAEALEKTVRSRLDAADIRWSVDSAVVQMGGLASLVALRARFADLVIQPRPYGEGRGIEDEAIIESAMFDGQTPVYVLPDDIPEAPAARRIVVAWNQSNEAMRAIRRALPLLKAADLVNIAIIDPPQHGPERSDPGGMLTQTLSRHGVRAEVSVLAKTMPRTTDVLLRHLRDQDGDLMVMGAYSHSRFREAILGGTTRNMLELSDKPIFMAH